MSWVKNKEGDYQVAKCEAKGCDVKAPAPGEYERDNPGERFPGWINLGWYCAGGTHYCPEHNPEND